MPQLKPKPRLWRLMYVNLLIYINRHALNKGIKELNDQAIFKQIPVGKQRRAGGGLKFTIILTLRPWMSYIDSIKAGSLTDERVFWVCQRPQRNSSIIRLVLHPVSNVWFSGSTRFSIIRPLKGLGQYGIEVNNKLLKLNLQVGLGNKVAST